jgi:hypothetical protein
MVLRPAERRQAADEKGDVVETGVRMLVEVAADPAGSGTPVAMRVLVRDQGDQLEQLAEGRPSDLPQRRLGERQVAVLAGSLEDRPRLTGGGDTCLSGAGAATLKLPYPGVF